MMELLNTKLDDRDDKSLISFEKSIYMESETLRIQEYIATLSTRLQPIKDCAQDIILSKTKYEFVDKYIGELLGQNQIVDIDISGLDDASAEGVTKVLDKLYLIV
jgi:hypothetical protein